MSRLSRRGRLPGRSGGSAPATPFTPASVANLYAWYRSDLGITLNGSNVSAWADQSGNARDLSQGTAANQPPFVASDANLNSRPSVGPFGATDILTRAAFGLAQPFTVFAVLYTDVSVTGYVGSASTGLLGFGTYVSSGDRVFMFGNTVRDQVISPAAPDAYAIGWIFDNASQSSITVNGTKTNQAAPGAADWSASNLGVGNHPSGTSPCEGFIAELAFYSRALTDGEQTQLYAYAQTRYGV